MCFYSNGGFSFTEVYNMPIWLRDYYYKKMQQTFEEKQKAIDDANRNQKSKIPKTR